MKISYNQLLRIRKKKDIKKNESVCRDIYQN